MYRNQGTRAMPPLAGGTTSIQSMIGHIASYIKSKTQRFSITPCDGLILRMHYRWSLALFIGSFFTVFYSWYYREVITCVSHFNADTQVRMDYVNICLSYPYVEQNNKRRYLLFYRWIHWVFLVLAGLYYVPRRLSKAFENPRTLILLERVASFLRDDRVRDTEAVEYAAQYAVFNMRTHNGLFFKYILTNCVALFIDIFSLFFLNFVLQDRFLYYGQNVYPFNRDIVTFTDPMSQTFPPFVHCEVDKAKMLSSQREEKLGCHLTFMELYEKLFLFIWFWLYALIILTSAYIGMTLLMFLPCFYRRLLQTEKSKMMEESDRKIRKTIIELTKVCKVGDVYLLYCLKPYFSHIMYFELLNKINMCLKQGAAASLMATQAQKPPPPSPQLHSTPTIRNRAGPQPPNNPDYLQSLLNPPHPAAARPVPRNMIDLQQRRPLLRKDTSLLIDG